MAPWIDGKLQNSLNLAMTSTRSFFLGHLSWVLNTTFMAWKNSYNTKCILMDLIIKDSNKCRYWDVWTNLYKPHEYSQALQTKTLFLFSIMGFNFNVKCCTNHMFTWKCSIQWQSSYRVIKKCEYQVINVALTQSPSS